MVKIGEVEKVRWYVLDDDRVVSFHTAIGSDHAGSWENTFFSERDKLPSATARKLGIKYDFMRNATEIEEVVCIANKGIQVKGVIEV